MRKGLRILGWISGVVVVLLVAGSLYAGNYLANYALKVEDDGYIASMGEDVFDGQRDSQAQLTFNEWVQTATVETWQMTSHDGLELAATYYPAEEASSAYVLAVHGYTVDHRDMNAAIVPYVRAGFNVLAIDQRSRGGSEGDLVTMGVKESDDVAQWAQQIVEFDPDAQIALYGASMGGATVLLAAGKELPDNVTAVVEDCAYTSAQAMFADQLGERFGLPEFPFLPAARAVSMVKFGVDFGQANPLKYIDQIDLPVLFIHGGADDYVPTYMGRELYEAFSGTKELLIVDGAGHNESFETDPELYYRTIFGFLTEHGFQGTLQEPAAG